MIQASFGRTTRAASIAGAYQYDTGQRLAMHGLPAPEAFSAEDDFLSGDLAVVEVHFSRAGDSQAEMRLGIWDADRQIWLAAVPDEYLTASEEIQVHVYVSHGTLDEQTRARTAYEGVFTPIARPAPLGVSTPEQEAEWAAKAGEIELALAACANAQKNALSGVESTNLAALRAQKPAENAEAAAQAAKTQTQLLETEGLIWQRATFTVSDLAPGSGATVSLTRVGSTPHFEFGIPRGANGTPGMQGEDGPTDVEFVMDGTTLIITTKT